MTSPESNRGSSHRPSPQPPGRLSRATASASRRGTWRDLDQASVMVVELLSGLLVWGGLGWFVGTRFGGHPWPFVIGSLLGFAGGFYLLYLRAEGRLGRPGTGAAPRRDDDGDTPQPEPADGGPAEAEGDSGQP